MVLAVWWMAAGEADRTARALFGVTGALIGTLVALMLYGYASMTRMRERISRLEQWREDHLRVHERINGGGH